jgi:hypothetical protein
MPEENNDGKGKRIFVPHVVVATDTVVNNVVVGHFLRTKFEVIESITASRPSTLL